MFIFAYIAYICFSECPEILEGDREDDGCCWPGVSSEWGDQEKEEITNNNCLLENELSGLHFKKDSRRDQLEERINILGTLVKAGCLLASQPIDVFFVHEEEQRLVYSLAYDAYRCKLQEVNTCKFSHRIFMCIYQNYNKILRLLFHFSDRSVFNQALQDTNFFMTFPQASFVSFIIFNAFYSHTLIEILIVLIH